MPKLDTKLHLNMYRGWKRGQSLLAKDEVYGLEWGDPEVVDPLRYVRDHFLRPYVSPETTVVEIGPGGGRWTRYMLDAKQIYAIDYHQELLDELKSNIDSVRIVFLKNDGDNFPNVPNESVDFVFSFGTFVHLDMDIIDRYLQNMKPLLKPESNVVLHYSDKTKPLAKMNPSFSENDPDQMRNLVQSHGYYIYEEDIGTMWHSSLVRFGLRNDVT